MPVKTIGRRGVLWLLSILLVVSTTWANAADVVRIGNVAKGGTYQRVLDRIMPRFEEENPGIRVEVEPSTGGLDGLIVQIAAGTAPDIVALQSYLAGMFYDKDLVVPLDLEVFGAKSYGDLLSRLFPGIENVLMYKGKVYFMPVELNTFGLYYNKDLFHNAGLSKPPATWQELYDMARKVTRKDPDGTFELAGVALRGGSYFGTQWFVHMTRQNGGSWLTPDGKANFSSPEAVEAIELYRTFFERDIVNGYETHLARGQVMFMPGILYEMFNILNANPIHEIDAAPFPVLEGGMPSTPSYALGWFVSSTSPKQKEAWKVVKYISSPEAAKDWWDEANLLTPYLGAWLQRLIQQDPFLLVFLNELTNANPGIMHANYTDISKVIGDAEGKIRRGEDSVRNVLTNLDVEVNAILSSAGK